MGGEKGTWKGRQLRRKRGMTPEILFAQELLLQGSGYTVTKCTFEGEPKKLILGLDFKAGTKFKCPDCAEVAGAHDTVEKKWRHLNFFQYECELVARVPRYLNNQFYCKHTIYHYTDAMANKVSR